MSVEESRPKGEEFGTCECLEGRKGDTELRTEDRTSDKFCKTRGIAKEGRRRRRVPEGLGRGRWDPAKGRTALRRGRRGCWWCFLHQGIAPELDLANDLKGGRRREEKRVSGRHPSQLREQQLLAYSQGVCKSSAQDAGRCLPNSPQMPTMRLTLCNPS